MTPETSIYEFAKQGLMKFPDKTALWFYDKSMSYRELFKHIEHAANQLAALGVRKGTVVTIHLPNCPQTIIAVYAVAKLGGVCNMVHALLPAEGLCSNMAFTNSRFLITGSHAEDLPEIDFAEKILFADISSHMGLIYRLGYSLKNKNRRPTSAIMFDDTSRDAVHSPTTVLAEDCAVYMHSSGSTGEPKTVMLSHLALNNWVGITQVYFREVDISQQVCLSALPYFHALGFQMDMHRVLSCGGTLVLLARWDGRTAVKFIKKYSITTMAGVPAMCRSLLSQKEFSGEKIMQLRSLFIGGEKMDRSLKQAINDRLHSKDVSCVFEGYGLTETASACAVLEKSHYHIDSCGYPQHGITCMVRQEDGTLLAEGEGEFVIGGNCLMMGYLNDPTATEQAFIDWNGKKLFCSGDYGRIDESGLLYFKDRIKNTIIRNGNNVFPYEVESVIRTVDGVRDICVIGIPDLKYDTQMVCACIVADNGIAEEDIQKAVIKKCKHLLPAVSVPSKCVFLDEIPKNIMGKIDRKKLEQCIL